MSKLIKPEGYKALLDMKRTEQGIKLIKDFFQENLSTELRLSRVTAPLFVLKGLGINDDLNGVERPVTFHIKDLGEAEAEVVHSLAKWKRLTLAEYGIEPGYGIYTDMNAIRADEELDNLHSLYVDQWDWEAVITSCQRNVGYLKNVVERIYSAIRRTEYLTCETYPELKPFLPEKIHFIHSEDLLGMYPSLSPKEREDEICRKYGAVFLMGIGGKLSDGKKLVLITGHRRENFGDGFISMCKAIKALTEKYPEVDFVYPMHLNPNVRRPIHEVFGEDLSGLGNMFFIEPLEYLSFVYLMEKSTIVLTDSGGIQEEAPGLGKPVLVMRDTTERPEALEAGTVKLVGTDFDKIVGEVSALLEDRGYYDRMSKAVNPYGDGRACGRIVNVILLC